MGLAIMLEIGHGSDERLRHALRPLSVFGLIHGNHEWLEMFSYLHPVGIQPEHFWLIRTDLVKYAIRKGIIQP